jgi:hypothetical protein
MRCLPLPSFDALCVAASLAIFSAGGAAATEANQTSTDPDPAKALALLEGDDAGLTAKKITRINLGDINLPSGRIIAADPLILTDAQNFFTTVVKPGNYQVYVYAQDTGRGDIRVGLAELRFSNAKPLSWKQALVGNQELSSLKPGEIFGYGVDAGLGSFMSPETLAVLEADMTRAEKSIPDFSDYYTDVLAKDLDKPTPNAIVFPIPSSPENRVAIFQSGWGDGFYPSYFGYDAKGDPVTLVTTFFVFEENL